MSIAIFLKEVGNLYGGIYRDKDSNVFRVSIWYKSKTRVYNNYFITYENARRALNRNIKKYSD